MLQLPLVDNAHVYIQHDDGNQLDDITNQHCDVGGVIVWGFATSECLRTDDVSHAVTSEQDGRGELLLRVACDV